MTISALPGRRLMLVHAHPDDETLGNGITIAGYAAAGVDVCLVTCTLGEEGEVLVPELEHLGADHDDALGPHRLGELEAAMAALGVTDFVRLGGDGHYRDSGMAYSETGTAIARDVLRDGIFWTADLLEAANLLVPLIRDRRPHVLVTYNEFGGYGHPDHVQAHRVAMYGSLLAGAPSYRPDLGEAWAVPRVLWTAMSRSRMIEGIATLRARGDTETFADWDVENRALPMLSDDDEIAAVVSAPGFVGHKIAAMRAHASQIAFDGPFFAAMQVLGDDMWSEEFYRFAAGQPFPGPGPATDLFEGLE